MKRTKMKNLKYFLLAAGCSFVLAGCESDEVKFDASGAFEAEEIVVSAEASGVIRQLDIEEGQALKAGELIGYVDSTQLALKKKQLETQIDAILSRKPNVGVQLAALQEQLKAAEKEKARLEKLVKGDAATPKQLDDVEAQIDVIRKQIDAQRSALSITSGSLSKEVVPLNVQIEQLKDQLRKCRIVNPVAGTVLVQYAHQHEMIGAGRPVYKIADLKNMILRVYISGSQLPQVALNQPVKVLTDDGNGGYHEDKGTIVWINDKSEFTPKTIQTKDERANLVYAMKVKVSNTGRYKIGMYGEIQL